jgi:hypothetical protein
VMGIQRWGYYPLIRAAICFIAFRRDNPRRI